jgi:hypothetical protein
MRSRPKAKADPEMRHEAGFVSSGISMWSRSRAQGVIPNLKPAPIKRKKSAFQLLLEAESGLAEIRRELPGAIGDRREKALRDIDAKENFISRLRKEIAST